MKLILSKVCKNPNSAKNMLIWIKSSAMRGNLNDKPRNVLPENSAQLQTLKFADIY